MWLGIADPTPFLVPSEFRLRPLAERRRGRLRTTHGDRDRDPALAHPVSSQLCPPVGAESRAALGRREWPTPTRHEEFPATSGQRHRDATTRGRHEVSTRRFGSPNGIRTRAATLRGWCPRPLDDGAVQVESRSIGGSCRSNQPRTTRWTPSRDRLRGSSGERTRTPNDRARTCCVAYYTTPEGLGHRSR